jgi:hypothetical protein
MQTLPMQIRKLTGESIEYVEASNSKRAGNTLGL